jgi:hypothetical protein
MIVPLVAMGRLFVWRGFTWGSVEQRRGLEIAESVAANEMLM